MENKTQKTVNKALIVLIQGMVLLYSFVSMLSKVASNFLKSDGFFSFSFLGTFIGMIIGLGVYAILWQIVLKKVDLTVAYANKGLVLLWSLLWSVVFFHEKISWNNVVGVVLVIVGIIMVTKND